MRSSGQKVKTIYSKARYLISKKNLLCKREIVKKTPYFIYTHILRGRRISVVLRWVSDDSKNSYNR
jgi:hypothetical protein